MNPNTAWIIGTVITVGVALAGVMYALVNGTHRRIDDVRTVQCPGAWIALSVRLLNSRTAARTGTERTTWPTFLLLETTFGSIGTTSRR